MIIRKLKKKAITMSVYLIVIGCIIAILGFGISGFNLSKFEKSDTYKWYRTIRISEGLSLSL